MSNTQETKEQKVVIIEGNDTTVTEEKKVGFIKGTYAKAKEGFHKNKKTIIVLVPFYRGAVVFREL